MSTTPQDFHALNYAMKLLDDLGLSHTGNKRVVTDCIEAIAKEKRIPQYEAYDWLTDRAMYAKRHGELVNYWWFRDAKYKSVELKRAPVIPFYQPIDKAATEKEQAHPEWEEWASKARAKLREICSWPGAKRHTREELLAQVEQCKKTSPTSKS